MKSVVEAVFEDVLFVPKSDAPINIQDFNPDGGISVTVTLTQATPKPSSPDALATRAGLYGQTIVSRPNQPRVEIETSRGEFESDTSWLNHYLIYPG